MDEAETLAEDDEHKRLIRIVRLRIQLTQAVIIENQRERKIALQAYVGNARELGVAQVISENRSYEAWANDLGLQW